MPLCWYLIRKMSTIVVLWYCHCGTQWLMMMDWCHCVDTWFKKCPPLWSCDTILPSWYTGGFFISPPLWYIGNKFHKYGLVCNRPEVFGLTFLPTIHVVLWYCHCDTIDVVLWYHHCGKLAKNHRFGLVHSRPEACPKSPLLWSCNITILFIALSYHSIITKSSMGTDFSVGSLPHTCFFSNSIYQIP